MKIYIPVPPSANVIWKVGKNRIYRSKEYKAWLAAAYVAARESRGQSMPWPYTQAEPLFPRGHSVKVGIEASVSRRRDIDNLVKPIMDFLQYAGLIDDDRWVDMIQIGRVSEIVLAADTAQVSLYR